MISRFIFKYYNAIIVFLFLFLAAVIMKPSILFDQMDGIGQLISAIMAIVAVMELRKSQLNDTLQKLKTEFREKENYIYQYPDDNQVLFAKEIDQHQEGLRSHVYHLLSVLDEVFELYSFYYDGLKKFEQSKFKFILDRYFQYPLFRSAFLRKQKEGYYSSPFSLYIMEEYFALNRGIYLEPQDNVNTKQDL